MEDTKRKITLAHNPAYGVLDLATGTNLTLEEFIGVGDYGELIERRRLALEHDLIEGRVRYVCQACRKPMVLRSLPADKSTENRFFLKHRYRSECGGSTGLTHEAICALRYANTKESPAHKAYKQLLVDSLACDQRFSSIQTEERWFDQDGVRWRQPDVQAVVDGQRVALEVQLSTTFVEVVAQRQAFYRRNVGRLLWFFRDLSIAGFRQAEDDVFHTNNRNAFLVDESTLADSQTLGRFMLDCAWLEPVVRDGKVVDQIRRQRVGFDQLTFDVSQIGVPRAYFFDYDAARAALGLPQEPAPGEPDPEPDPLPAFPDFTTDEALRQIMAEFMRGFPYHVSNTDLWAVLRPRFKRRGFELPKHVKFDPIFPALQAAYSAQAGRPVGGDQQFLIQLANTLYNSHKPALWIFSVMMAHYNRGTLFRLNGDQKAWAEKVKTYRQAWLDDDETYRPIQAHIDLIAFLFPEAAKALRQSPQEYVRRLTARGGN
ncbi:DUF6035 family protein [Luteimonas sp. SDU101]|uniref:DUF6035 family protein n=1 Tax=Luteimonas sp. SDU101 TaxID=3422593 RepID=UPI003EBB9687